MRCGATRFTNAGLASKGRPPTADTVFEIGSLSKLFTGLLLADAIAQGRASADDDVRRYLPAGFGNLQWKDGTSINLGQLADTTSGLPDYLPDPAPLAKLPAARVLPGAAKLLAQYTDDAFLRDLASISLQTRPGSAARHSNVAAQVLGLAVSRMYNQPYAAVLRQQVEAPNRMHAGTGAVSAPRMAAGHDRSGKLAPTFRGPSLMPAGGLRYSARDMARFIKLQLSREPAVELSHIARAKSDDGDVAFTWLVSSPRGSVKRYRLTGSTFGFSSYIEVYPALDYGIALLANRGGGDVQNQLMAMAERNFNGTIESPCEQRR